MSDLSKELLRKYISEQNFANANEVLFSMKELFGVQPIAIRLREPIKVKYIK